MSEGGVPQRHGRAIGVATGSPGRDRLLLDGPFLPLLDGIWEEAGRLGWHLVDPWCEVATGRILLYPDSSPPGLPFVSVGRRLGPSIDADYRSAVRDLVARVRALGHERLAYIGHGTGSCTALYQGFCEATRDLPAIKLTPDNPAEVLITRTTAVFVESYADGVTIAAAARRCGLAVPEDLSILTLGGPSLPQAGPTLSGFSTPYREMGQAAIQALIALLEGGPPTQRLLPCHPTEGTTLSSPSRSSNRT